MSLEHSFKRGLTSLLRLFLRSRVSPVPPPDEVRGVLIIRQHNQLGDMLCVVPLLRALKAKYPHARLSLIASPVNADVMRGNRYLDEVFLYDKREFLEDGRIRPRALLRFIRELRRHGFTIAIVPSTVSTSFTSDLLAYLSGAPCRIGAASLDGKPNNSSFLFTVPVSLDWRSSPKRHQTARNLDTARNLQLPGVSLELEMTLSETEKQEGGRYVREARRGKKYAIGYHPGAGKAPNRWPVERFSALINALSNELDAAALITCGPMDEEVVEAVKETLTVGYQVVERQGIRKVASILSNLNLVVTNDTGIMHVAAAVSVPTLSLFGPTSPEQWAPTGIRNRYIAGMKSDISLISLEEVVETARSMICS